MPPRCSVSRANCSCKTCVTCSRCPTLAANGSISLAAAIISAMALGSELQWARCDTTTSSN